MPLSLKVHHYDDRNGRSVLVKETHYMRIEHEKEPPLFIQKGKVYSAGGAQINELPSWWEAELKKVNPKALNEVGYKWPAATPKTSQKASSSTS